MMNSARSSRMPQLSFIVPSYNEEDNVIPFYREFSKVFDNSEYTYEIIYIDDGSSDATLSNLKKLASTCQHVRVISFSRNFGKEAAIWAGLEHARGDIVGIIDADLQQPPLDAKKMVELLEADESVDVVAAYQEHRHENPIMIKCKSAFYRVLDSVSNSQVLADASDFRVFRRNVADAILSMPEYYRFSKGIFAFIGFNTKPYAYTPADRLTGTSKWNFTKLLKYAFEGLIAFSTAPLRMATYLGLGASIAALVYLIVVVIQKCFFGISVSGYATIVGLILLLGGIQLLMLGIVGEYLGRTYIQGKQRPIYIEARSFSSDDCRDIL